MPMSPEQALADAREKYHALVTGTMARVLFDQNGEKIEFTAAKRADLYAYIMELEAQLAPPVDGTVRGPVGFIF